MVDSSDVNLNISFAMVNVNSQLHTGLCGGPVEESKEITARNTKGYKKDVQKTGSYKLCVLLCKTATTMFPQKIRHYKRGESGGQLTFEMALFKDLVLL